MPNRDSLLRHSCSAAVETDMREFEGALDEDWCHFFGDKPGKTLCGCTYDVKRTPHEGTYDTLFCDGCGLRNCPECQALDRAA